MARNAEETRNKILAAAESEFARKGLAGARVDEIAEKSGYNKGMIYQYFGNKENLYQKVLYNVYSRLSALEEIILSANKDCIETIRTIVSEYFKFLQENPSFVKLIMWENLNEAQYLSQSDALNIKDPMLNALHTVIEKGKKEGVFSSNAEDKQVALSLIMGSYSYFSNIYTLSKVIHIDLMSEENITKRIQFVTDSILNYLTK